MSTRMEEVGVRLRKMREAHRMGQRQVARALNVTQPAYLRMEKGQTELRLKHVPQLAALYGQDLREVCAELLESENYEHQPEPYHGTRNLEEVEGGGAGAGASSQLSQSPEQSGEVDGDSGDRLAQ